MLRGPQSTTEAVTVAGCKGVEQVVLFSLVTASIAFAISAAGLFEGMREQLILWNPWLGKLASCGYCLGHWISFGRVVIYQPRILRAKKDSVLLGAWKVSEVQ